MSPVNRAMPDTPVATAAAAATSETGVPALPAKRDAQAPDDEAPAKRDRPSAPADAPMQVVLMHEHASVPKRGTPQSAGFDLSAGEDAVVKAGERAVVNTGLKLRIPDGCYGRVAPRSGLAVKKFVDVGAGVIDADYRGQVGVVLFNFGKEDLVVKVGDRIAQLVLEKISSVEAVVVAELDDTARGEGGFGSTGVAKTL